MHSSHVVLAVVQSSELQVSIRLVFRASREVLELNLDVTVRGVQFGT